MGLWVVPYSSRQKVGETGRILPLVFTAEKLWASWVWFDIFAVFLEKKKEKKKSVHVSGRGREMGRVSWRGEDVVYEIQQRNGSLPLYSHEEIPETFYLSIHVSSHPVTQLTQSF